MIITGKEALDLEFEKASEDESLFYKLEAGHSTNMVFLGGLDGIISWKQHNWWVKDSYGKNPGGYAVKNNVIFTSLKENWSDPDTIDPGFIMGSEGEQKWAASVLVEIEEGGKKVQKEKVFFFGKAIWNGIVTVYRDIQSEFGDDVDINDKWLRLSNSGDGPNRYSVNFMGKFFKDYKTYVPKHDPREFVKSYNFPEIVDMMRTAGLPIDDKLAENNLNELGMTIEDKASE